MNNTKQFLKSIKATTNALKSSRDRVASSLGNGGYAGKLSVLKRMYGDVIAHEALLSCMYEVQFEDVFGMGGDIPWFKDKTLRYLVSDTSLSFGSAESDTFQAGSFQANLLTHQTSDTMDMTFIETASGDIFKSYRACFSKAFNSDGTTNEPRKYTFKVSIAVVNHKKHSNTPPIGRAYLVSVKEGGAELSASGRSDVLKETVTFQKIRPLIFK